MNATIYHDPACATSSNVLALLREAGEHPQIIEYLKTPPERATLERLIADSGMDVRDALQIRGTLYRDLNLDEPSLTDAQLIDAMLAHPVLLNRPFVVTPRGTRLCRPSDVALDLLENWPTGSVVKEDGVPFIVAREIPGENASLVSALLRANLPINDLSDSQRRFFAFDTLDGSRVGYGGIEQYGRDVLVRSVTVEPHYRGMGIGRNLVSLLLRKAFDSGARAAWLLTTDAQAFFTKTAFALVKREDAPAVILATRQAAELCPSAADLFSRPITL